MTADEADSLRRIQAIRQRRRAEVEAQRAHAAREADGPDFWNTYALGEEAQARRDYRELEDDRTAPPMTYPLSTILCNPAEAAYMAQRPRIRAVLKELSTAPAEAKEAPRVVNNAGCLTAGIGKATP